MMNIYAVLNSELTTVIAIDPQSGVPESDRFVLLNGLDVIPDLGWNYDGTTFTPPIDTSRNSLLIDIGQVVDQLTDDEYEVFLDLDTYDKKETKEEKQKSVKIKRVRMKLERAGKISPAQFSLLAQVFVTEGVLTQARFDEILAALN